MEFSDQPMEQIPENHKFGLYDAKYTIDYLDSYLDRHAYAGKRLRERIMCNFQVKTIFKAEDGVWKVTGHTNPRAAEARERAFTAPKIIIASGFTSEPNMPNFNMKGFSGRIIHSKEYGREADSILTGPKRRISVLGGGKSAADMVYAAAKAGHEVSWIIRKSGSGPGLLLKVEPVGKYRNATELMQARFMSTLSPNMFMKRTWWTWFVHSTWLGRWLLNMMFGFVQRDSEKAAGYHTTEGVEGSFKLLKPDAE